MVQVLYSRFCLEVVISLGGRMSLLRFHLFLTVHPIERHDIKHLMKYLDKAASSQTDLEVLCSLHLQLDNCNSLKREDHLDRYHLAESYLDQKPGACWEDIVMIFCELSKRSLAKEVAERYHVNTRCW